MQCSSGPKARACAATREPAWRVALRGRRAPRCALTMGGENSPVEMPDQFAFTLLSTWWLLRGGCTRSHSELGRETPQRRWYSVSRRGRVGRCQVYQGVKDKHRDPFFTWLPQRPSLSRVAAFCYCRRGSPPPAVALTSSGRGCRVRKAN
jgi:hypothetical protein